MASTTMAEPRRIRVALGLLGRNRDFARLWAGETISAFGSRVTTLALPLVAVERLDAGPGQMGLLGAAQTVPFLLLALAAGIAVDRMRRRPILVAANVGRGLLLAVIPALAALGELRIWHLYAVALGVGACGVFFELAYQSYLPRIVAREDLTEANSKLTASGSVAEIGGPGLAGAVVAAVGAPLAMALDAASFLWSAGSLRRIDAAEPTPDPPPAGGLRAEVAEGVRETLRNRYLVAFAGEAATYNVAWNAMGAVLVLWAVREVGLGAGTLGLVLSVGAVGALAGALLSGRLAARLGVGGAMTWCAVVSNVGVLLIPLAAVAPAPPVLVLGVAVFVQGLGGTGTNVHTYAIRQAVVPDAVMGRVNAVYRLLTYGFIPAGALIGGVLGETIGLEATLWVGAVALFPSWLWLACSPARHLRELPTEPAA